MPATARFADAPGARILSRQRPRRRRAAVLSPPPFQLSLISLQGGCLEPAASKGCRSSLPRCEHPERHQLNGIAMTLTDHDPRAFDLNVGTVLDHWTAEFALREIIANALDEQALTDTQDPTISQDGRGWWHVRDYGRGIRHFHLTQDESPEKRQDDRVIGQFGMGLKDALALFDRIGVTVAIKSRHGDIQLVRKPKASFDDVVTL